MKTITLTPAYGREYKSIKAIKADFEANKDFIIVDISEPFYGKPANKRDLKRAGYNAAFIRYANIRKVTRIEIN